jgi:hypothetical protein
MSYFEQQEREQMERDREEDLNNQQMMYDELMEKREILEEDILKIKNQIAENKILIEKSKEPMQTYSSDNQPKDAVWYNKAKYALGIKELQLKKTNRKLNSIQRSSGAEKKKTQYINDSIKAKLREVMGEEDFNKYIEKIKEEVSIW